MSEPTTPRDEVTPETAAPAQGVTTVSHDLPVSDALRAHLLRDWAEDEPETVEPHDGAPYFAKRRDAVSARYPGEALVVPAGGLVVRSNDTDYRFRPSSSFVWLCGGGEPDAVLVLTPEGEGHRATLFTRDRAVPGSEQFFRDRRHGEIWVGRGRSLRETSLLLEVECRTLDDLPAVLAGLDGLPIRVVRGFDPGVDAAVAEGDPAGDDELATCLDELRLVKDDWEVAQIQDAVDATVRGFEDVVRELGGASAGGERWVEGTFFRRARVEGNDLGYDTIAACGAHATTLHWIRNDGPVRDGDLLLLDAGVENRNLYTADVTRTLPVGGRFSPAQRWAYDLVHAAQEAALGTLRPGARFKDYHDRAQQVLAHGLAARGLLPVSAEESLQRDSGLHRRYTLHAAGHMLGLDVHDCAQARAEAYVEGVLEVGNVLTVEPGLYFQPNDLSVPPELRGIGVRIEDDVLITEDGYRLLSGALPRAADDVEAWMAALAG